MQQPITTRLSKLSRNELESYILRLESDIASESTRQDKVISSLEQENSSLRSQIRDLNFIISSLQEELRAAVSKDDYVKSLLIEEDFKSIFSFYHINNNKPYSGCFYNCDDCLKEGPIENVVDFCNGYCHRCECIRKAKTKISSQSIEKEIRKEINRSVKPSPPQSPTNNHSDDIIQNDRFLSVTLTVNPSWGSRDYLIYQLIKNFNKMSPPSYLPIATAYVVADNESGIPHLHGLIRYNWENVDKKKCKISESTSTFKNIIQCEGTKGKSGQEIGRTTLQTLSVYDKRKYTTSKSSIIEAWEYMKNQHGSTYQPIGDSLDSFL